MPIFLPLHYIHITTYIAYYQIGINSGLINIQALSKAEGLFSRVGIPENRFPVI
jgi:hypothetical protein